MSEIKTITSKMVAIKRCVFFTVSVFFSMCVSHCVCVLLLCVCVCVPLHSHIFRREETLREYEVYRKFLLRLSPPAWQQRQGGPRASDLDQEGRGGDQDHTRPLRRRSSLH